MHYISVRASAMRNVPVLLSSLAFTNILAGLLAAQSLTAQNYPTLASPNGVALGDFNRDGNCDAVAIHQSSSTPSLMTLMLGDGTGALLAPTAFTCAGTGGAGIVAGDWNGDSFLDVITVELVNSTSTFSRISWFAGNGAGSFQTAVPYIVSAGARSGAATDFNLDGNLDFVTANSSTLSNSVTVLLGDGAGGFLSSTDFSAASKPWAVATGDFNMDGAPDITCANNGGASISVLLGNGSGVFPGGAVHYVAGNGPRGISAGDLNGDGTEDIVCSNGSSNDVSVFYGNGTGAMTFIANFLVGTNPSSVTMGDVNGDGFADICTTDQTGAISNMESVLLGNGTSFWPAPNNFPTGNFPSSSRIGDLNADGRADVVVSNYGGSGMTVLLNTATPAPSYGNFYDGTMGCRGRLGISVPTAPSIGNTAFRINTTNAPPRTLGLLIVTTLPDLSGSDPLGLGAALYLDLFASTEVFALDAISDISGCTSTLAPIPRDNNLIGNNYYAQGLFIEATGGYCSTSPLNVVTTIGLGLTITP